MPFLRNMNAKEKKRKALVRYSFSGLFATLMGPTLFWLLYPIGLNIAFIFTEICIHILRYLSFKFFVFPASKGYSVSIWRYGLSVLPLTLTTFVSMTLLHPFLDRLLISIVPALITIFIGFIWSRFVYLLKT